MFGLINDKTSKISASARDIIIVVFHDKKWELLKVKYDVCVQYTFSRIFCVVLQYTKMHTDSLRTAYRLNYCVPKMGRGSPLRNVQTKHNK